MSEKRCIIASMKKGIKENPTTKKYLDKMVSDGIDEDTALNIMILAWQNHKRWNDGMMSEYKCPKCKSPLFYHHEDRETVTFECKKCKHFVLARKC